MSFLNNDLTTQPDLSYDADTRKLSGIITDDNIGYGDWYILEFTAGDVIFSFVEPLYASFFEINYELDLNGADSIGSFIVSVAYDDEDLMGDGRKGMVVAVTGEPIREGYTFTGIRIEQWDMELGPNSHYEKYGQLEERQPLDIVLLWEPNIVLDFISNPITDGILIPPNHHLVTFIHDDGGREYRAVPHGPTLTDVPTPGSGNDWYIDGLSGFDMDGIPVTEDLTFEADAIRMEPEDPDEVGTSGSWNPSHQGGAEGD